MNFIGVLANTVSVLLGGLIGAKFGSKIPDKVGQTLMSGLALCVLFVGIDGVKLQGNLVIAVLSVAIGGLIGELIDFDAHIGTLGLAMQKKLSGSMGDVGASFVNATLLVCMGAMAIVGSIESGMSGNADTLLTKALIDFIVIMVLASTTGIGCAFAAIPIFLYQGGLTLLAGVVAPYMGPAVIEQMSFVGSILILGVGLNMLELTHIRLGNLVLAPFLPILLQFML